MFTYNRPLRFLLRLLYIVRFRLPWRLMWPLMILASALGFIIALTYTLP